MVYNVLSTINYVQGYNDGMYVFLLRLRMYILCHHIYLQSEFCLAKGDKLITLHILI